MPAPEDGMKDGKFQHSITENPLRVVMAVRLREGVVSIDSIGGRHGMSLEGEELVTR